METCKFQKLITDIGKSVKRYLWYLAQIYYFLDNISIKTFSHLGKTVNIKLDCYNYFQSETRSLLTSSPL